MGFLRGLGKFFAGSAFSLLLSLFLVLFILGSVTEHDNVVSLSSSVLEEQVMQNPEYKQMSDAFDSLSDQCSEIKGAIGVSKEAFLPINPSPTGNFVLELDKEALVEEAGKQGLNFDCETLKKSNSNNFIKGFVTNMIDGLYYKRYTCEFVNCILNGQITVVISEQGNKFFKQSMNAMLVPLAIAAILLFILCVGWFERARAFGWNFAMAGLPIILVMNSPQMVPNVEGMDVGGAVSFMFKQVSLPFEILFWAGLALLVVGYFGGLIWKLSGLGKDKKEKKESEKESKEDEEESEEKDDKKESKEKHKKK